jgi:hypothetical protein
MKLLFFVYKTIDLISRCVRTRPSKCVTHAWALNFWWIIKVSGSDKAKEKEKIAVWYHWLWTSRSLTHTVEHCGLADSKNLNFMCWITKIFLKNSQLNIKMVKSTVLNFVFSEALHNYISRTCLASHII